MCGDGSSAYSVRGSKPCCMASTILISPATPAAACAGAVLDFTAPRHQRRPAPRRQDRVSVAARIRQALHDQDPRALGQAHAIGLGRERLASPVSGLPWLTRLATARPVTSP